MSFVVETRAQTLVGSGKIELGGNTKRGMELEDLMLLTEPFLCPP